MKLTREQLDALLKAGNCTVASDSPYDPTKQNQGSTRPGQGVENSPARIEPEKPECQPAATLGKATEGKSEDSRACRNGSKTFVRFRFYRVKLQDRDNAYASGKCLLDRLRDANIIGNDTEDDIEQIVRQIKVKHYELERTEVILFQYDPAELESTCDTASLRKD